MSLKKESSKTIVADRPAPPKLPIPPPVRYVKDEKPIPKR